MNIQRDKRSDRSAGISFLSNVNPILSSFQKGLVAKIMDAKEYRSHGGRIA